MFFIFAFSTSYNVIVLYVLQGTFCKYKLSVMNCINCIMDFKLLIYLVMFFITYETISVLLSHLKKGVLLNLNIFNCGRAIFWMMLISSKALMLNLIVYITIITSLYHFFKVYLHRIWLFYFLLSTSIRIYSFCAF